MKKPIKTKKSTQTIRRVGELLQNVLGSFGWYGIGLDVAENSSDATVREGEDHADAENERDENGDEQNGEEDYEPAQYYFDPSDVQVAVDEAISAIIDEGLIEEFSNPKEPPELTDICAVLFGAESEITKQIEYFEDLISGYEDRAHIDDLKEAYGILASVVEKISSKAPKK